MFDDVPEELVWISDRPDSRGRRPRGVELRGKYAFDADCERVGIVDDVLVDARAGKVRFLRIAASGYFGIGPGRYLVPINAVIRVTEERVRFDRDREQIAAAPAFDPAELMAHFFDRLYGYYGYRPYWDADYVDPSDLYRP